MNVMDPSRDGYQTVPTRPCRCLEMDWRPWESLRWLIQTLCLSCQFYCLFIDPRLNYCAIIISRSSRVKYVVEVLNHYWWIKQRTLMRICIWLFKGRYLVSSVYYCKSVLLLSLIVVLPVVTPRISSWIFFFSLSLAKFRRYPSFHFFSLKPHPT